MIFGYPNEAILDNWFHDCICTILRSIHASVQSAQPQGPWPAIIPEPYRGVLQRRTGLRDRIDAYTMAVASLNGHELQKLVSALEEQNRIQLLLEGASSCDAIDELPEAIRHPARELFSFAFDLLTDLGIRDRQYAEIYDRAPYHLCPFCGCEYFDAPGAPREGLDHYLPRSKYPFAAANLTNLVPMGSKCNSSYKLAQDILYKEDGTRRKSFYPYHHGGVHVSLTNSKPFARPYGLFPYPDWVIEFEPSIEETSTWDTVFHIRERYSRDILDPDFSSWLRDFSSWCRSANIRPTTEQDVMDALRDYSEYWETAGVADRAFLKAAVFRMLLHHYEQGNQRIIDMINMLAIAGMR